jgi:hypothetical protein
MTTILYGGTKEDVIKQLGCQHDWHGPCIDDISRYFKCKGCKVIERDCTEGEFWKLAQECSINAANEGHAKKRIKEPHPADARIWDLYTELVTRYDLDGRSYTEELMLVHLEAAYRYAMMLRHAEEKAASKAKAPS